MKFTKLIRNKKAISPIFATLILIAIAVIAGIVVYMFTSGTLGDWTGGGTAVQEKAAVQGVGSVNSSYIDVYASYIAGGNPIIINGAIVKDAAGNSQIGEVASIPLPTAGTLTTVPVTGLVLTSGQSYSVTLTTAKGGSFPSSSFNGPAPAAP